MNFKKVKAQYRNKNLDEAKNRYIAWMNQGKSEIFERLSKSRGKKRRTAQEQRLSRKRLKSCEDPQFSGNIARISQEPKKKDENHQQRQKIRIQKRSKREDSKNLILQRLMRRLDSKDPQSPTNSGSHDFDTQRRVSVLSQEKKLEKSKMNLRREQGDSLVVSPAPESSQTERGQNKRSVKIDPYLYPGKVKIKQMELKNKLLTNIIQKQRKEIVIYRNKIKKLKTFKKFYPKKIDTIFEDETENKQSVIENLEESETRAVSIESQIPNEQGQDSIGNNSTITNEDESTITNLILVSITCLKDAASQILERVSELEGDELYKTSSVGVLDLWGNIIQEKVTDLSTQISHFFKLKERASSPELHAKLKRAKKKQRMIQEQNEQKINRLSESLQKALNECDSLHQRYHTSSSYQKEERVISINQTMTVPDRADKTIFSTNSPKHKQTKIFREILSQGVDFTLEGSANLNLNNRIPFLAFEANIAENKKNFNVHKKPKNYLITNRLQTTKK